MGADSQALNAGGKDLLKDMLKAGIVDPAKVSRSALENAGSVAGMIISTEAVVAEKPEKDRPMPGGGGMDMPPM